MSKKVYGALSLTSLIIGMAIYLFFRDLNMVLFSFLPKPRFLAGFLVPVKPSAFSSLLLYNIPDALWFLSGILFLRFAWFYERKWQRVYIACFCMVALLLELSQLSKSVPGTFDVFDLIFMGFFACLESLIFNVFIRRKIR